MAIVTLTDRPKSVRNRCVIKIFGCVFVLLRCFLDFSVGLGAFVIDLVRYLPFSLHFNFSNGLFYYGFLINFFVTMNQEDFPLSHF